MSGWVALFDRLRLAPEAWLGEFRATMRRRAEIGIVSVIADNVDEALVTRHV